MAVSERPLIDAERLAIDEINRDGGVHGRRLEAVVEDGASDDATFRAKAEKLIDIDGVASVFGCWTSTCRRAVRQTFEDRHNLLWYPVQYEGKESSPNIIYTGAAPNQQIIPALQYGLEHFGKRVFLVGSNYYFPQQANAIIKDYLARESSGASVGEMYRDLGDWDFKGVVESIKGVQPDWIFNTVNGDSNVALFKALDDAKIRPERIPVMSVSVAEVEIPRIGIERIKGQYCAWNYFQSLGTDENTRFVEAFKRFTAVERVTDDPVEAAYFQVHLFAKAANASGSLGSGRDPQGGPRHGVRRARRMGAYRS